MLSAVLAGPAVAASAHASFSVESPITTNEGHATLAWGLATTDTGRSTPDFELQQSATPAFENPRARFRGTGKSLFVSGLESGSTFFRVRATRTGDPPGPWSDPLEVVVAYPPTRQVAVLLAIGCLIFIATTTAIFRGARRERNRG